MSEKESIKKPVMRNDLMRSFGRVKGRKLGKEQVFLIENLLPKIIVDVDKNVVPADLFEGTYSQFCIEIGFGRGEHLAEFAKVNPDIGLIGCEPFINGVSRLLKYINDDGIPNIRILNGDARILLEKLPDSCVDKIFILFPDPWPKSRHHRKRIISKYTLDLLHRVIKKDGILEVATDHVEYGQWIARHLENYQGFEETVVTKGKQNTPPADWIRTRYQEKAEEQGRGAQFFYFACV